MKNAGITIDNEMMDIINANPAAPKNNNTIQDKHANAPLTQSIKMVNAFRIGDKLLNLINTINPPELRHFQL